MKWRSEDVSERTLGKVMAAVVILGARKAIKYVSPSLVVTVAGRHRPSVRARTIEVVVTIGQPNSKARERIKQCRTAGEPFPIKKIQVKWWPPKLRRKG